MHSVKEGFIGAHKMAQSVKNMLQRHENPSLNPQGPNKKPGVEGGTCNLQVLGRQTGCWLANLEESMSSRFSKITYLKN